MVLDEEGELRSEKKGKGKGFIEPASGSNFTYTEKACVSKRQANRQKKKLGFLVLFQSKYFEMAGRGFDL